jgi:hypothetical protein
MRHLRVASTTLAALASLAAAETAPAVETPKAPAPAREYTTQPSRTITAGQADAKLTAKVALFVTDDGGRSWRKDQELPVVEGAAAMPAFTFVAPKDGAFGLWTVATSRDGRAEPEPVAGAAPKLELVVDRASPALSRLEATLGGVADGQATLALSWQVSDPNLGSDPVAIEVSTDLGKSFAVRHTGKAEGTTALTVPAEAPEIQVRVVARDLAGNVLTSPAKPVALPVVAKPANPEAALAAAVAALPAPAELGSAGRSGTPIVSAGESPLASAAPAAAPAATQPAATAAQPAGTAPAATPAAGTEPEVVANSDVETRYNREAGAPAEQPRGRQSGGGTEAVAAPQPSGPRATVVDPSVGFLTGGTAAAALESARKAEQDGDVEGALAQYLRLHRSSVAKTALEDELSLLRRIGDHGTIVAIVDQLQPELRTDAARLHAARASLRLGNPEAAAGWAAKVRASAPEAREALFVLGKALQSLGRNAEARRVFDQLSSGNDDIAAQARAEAR